MSFVLYNKGDISKCSLFAYQKKFKIYIKKANNIGCNAYYNWIRGKLKYFKKNRI